jgi:hypothetical protein
MNPGVLARADGAFVGNLTSMSPDGDRAIFAVVEVWSSRDLPEWVTVFGPPDQWALAPPTTNHQPQFLVLAEAVGDTLVVKNQCDEVREPSFAVPFDPSWAEFRPAGARPPTSDNGASKRPAGLLVLVGAILVIGFASTVAFRRTRALSG